MSLTEKIVDTMQRVNTLESPDMDEKESIARITKNYAGLKLSVRITTQIYRYRRCSDSLLCSDTMMMNY